MESQISIPKNVIRAELVSIPFKREGTWKAESPAAIDRITLNVSIPFKREGTWKVK